MRNWVIPSIAFILSTLSLVTLKSIAPDLMIRQAMFFAGGFVLFFLVSRIDSFTLQKLSLPAYLLLNMLLFLLLAIGKTTRGITGWIDFGSGFRFQPSQLAIIFVSLYVLGFLKSKIQGLRRQEKVSLSGFMLLLLLIMVPGSLIMAQPDFGTASVYFSSIAVVFFLPEISWKHLFGLGLFAILAVGIGWFFVLEPFQKSRITSFLSGTEVESDANYNARQSLIAVGSGQFLGRGLGQGVQSHLRFLPERQTDFIFASFAEEWGFIGSSLVVSLYFILIIFIIRNSFKFDEVFDFYYALILAMMITVQTGVNVGMNMGLLPITGITLPLLSYGGSSILTVFLMLGIHQGALLRHKRVRKLQFS